MGAKMNLLKQDASKQMISEIASTFLNRSRGIQELPFLVLSIRRAYLIRDSLNQLQQNYQHLKKKIYVQFDGEEGVDAGGLTKEWFLLLVRELFDPLYGMFALEDEMNKGWFSLASLENTLEYELVGLVLGLAIYNSTILDVPLPLATYKKLLNVPLIFDDLRELCPELAQGFQKMLEYDGDDFESVYDLTFETTYKLFGEVIVVPLIPNGSSIHLTKSNRQEYVDKYIEWKFHSSVQASFSAFETGFYRVVTKDVLSLFHPTEVELLVRGSADANVDMDALQSSAIYEKYHVFKSSIDPSDKIISWFWSILKSFSSKDSALFLLFVTGSDRVPVFGSGLSKLVLKVSMIDKEASESLPISHTCFNQIGLFGYPSREILEHKLRQAMEWSSGFHVK